MEIAKINIDDVLSIKAPEMESIHPFIAWSNEDMSIYPKARDNGFIDLDDDFLIGDSGGILMKMDFIFVNTERYSEVANFYNKHLTYTHLIEDTPAYNAFWYREGVRRREGLTLNCKLYKKDIAAYKAAKTDEERNALLKPLRITGNHYNYLNYGRINRRPTEEEKEQQKRLGYKKPRDIEGFPGFWDADYWSFKVDEFAENNDKNLVKAKARRKGYSYKEASSTANELNIYRDQTIVLAAYDLSYLTDPGAITTMAKKCLDWYEDQTYWARCVGKYPVEDNKNGTYQLGYQQSGEGGKIYGWKSILLSVTCASNPSAAIGKKAVKIKFEEGGKFPNLGEVLGVTLSNTESGGRSVGNVTIFGTGGTKDADWTAFEYSYYHPESCNAMAFENVWDVDSRHEICGFFHPNIWAYEDNDYITLDRDGNSNLQAAYDIDMALKKSKEKTLSPEKYIIHVGQRANSPSEAFNISVHNMYTSAGLIAHYKKVKYDPMYKTYFDGQFVEKNKKYEFVTNDLLAKQGIRTHHYVTNIPFLPNEDIEGCWRVWDIKPIYNEEGEIPPGVFRIFYDPVGTDKTRDEITNKHSLARITVRQMPNPYSKVPIKNRKGRLVAAWTGRKSMLSLDDMEFLKAILYYGGIGIPEVNRGETLNNFKGWHRTDLIIQDPVRYIDRYNSSRGRTALGVVMTPQLKLDTLGYQRDSLYEIVGFDKDNNPIYGYEYEYCERYLSELLKFKIKGNFDCISCECLQEVDLQALKVLQVEQNYGTSNKEANRIIEAFMSRI